MDNRVEALKYLREVYLGYINAMEFGQFPSMATVVLDRILTELSQGVEISIPDGFLEDAINKLNKSLEEFLGSGPMKLEASYLPVLKGSKARNLLMATKTLKFSKIIELMDFWTMTFPANRHDLLPHIAVTHAESAREWSSSFNSKTKVKYSKFKKMIEDKYRVMRLTQDNASLLLVGNNFELIASQEYLHMVAEIGCMMDYIIKPHICVDDGEFVYVYLFGLFTESIDSNILAYVLSEIQRVKDVSKQQDAQEKLSLEKEIRAASDRQVRSLSRSLAEQLEKQKATHQQTIEKVLEEKKQLSMKLDEANGKLTEQRLLFEIATRRIGELEVEAKKFKVDQLEMQRLQMELKKVQIGPDLREEFINEILIKNDETMMELQKEKTMRHELEQTVKELLESSRLGR